MNLPPKSASALVRVFSPTTGIRKRAPTDEEFGKAMGWLRKSIAAIEEARRRRG